MALEEIEAFTEYLKLRNLSPATIRRHYYCLRRYTAFCAARGCNPAQACEEDLLAYMVKLREQNMRPSSLRQTFASLSVYFKWLMRQKKLSWNPIPELKEIYLHEYKPETRRRQLISVEDAAKMILATMRARDRAILYLLFTTGIRRNELVSLDVGDLDFEKMEIHLKPTRKRSNKIAFLTPECARAIRRWLKVRETMTTTSPALFLNEQDDRLGPSGLDRRVAEAAQRVGLHNPKSERLEDQFCPHCCRHWFTTHLRRAGMPREFIQELRGDVRRDAIDIYDHIDKKELKESYLAHIPQLGV